MVDELLKRLLIEIQVNAEDAIQASQALRSDIEATKETFRVLQAESGESFDVVQARINELTVEPLKAKLRELGALMRTELEAGGMGVDTSAIEAQMASVRRQIAAVGVAFKELRAEAGQITAPILSASEGAQVFTRNVNAALTEMQELVASGHSVQAAFEGVKQTKMFSPTELSNARTQLTAIVKLQEQLKVTQMSSEERARLFTTQVAKAKAEMLKLVQAGFSVKAALTGIDDGTFTKGQLSEATRQLNKEMGNLGQQTSKTARILERIFAAGAIGFALGAIRSLINEMREATEAGAELARSFLDIAVNARALRREGGELLPGDWIQRAKDLSEVFTQFAQRDINSAVSQLIRLGRQAKLTDSDIQDLIDQTLILATVTGQDAADAANAVATAVESGYARGLKELVGAIDETTIAQEAIRRGLADTEDEVDKNIRALTVLTLLQEEAAVIGGDLALVQEALTGQYIANKNAIETLIGEIGESLLPATVGLQSVFISLLTVLDHSVQGLQILYAAFTAAKRVGDEFFITILKLGGAFKALANPVETANAFIREFGEQFGIALKNINPALLGEAASEVDNIGRAAREATPDIAELSDAFEKALIKAREIFIHLGEAIAKENRRFQQQILDDTEKFEFDLAKLYSKLQFDIAKVNRTFNDKLAEVQDDYRDKEIEAEEDFQEKLRKLRENFLFNLEDALRDRDARQIIRLIRQFNLRKTQLEREHEIEKDQRKRNFEDQIEDIKRQRAIRLRELQIEYAFRRSQMEAAFKFEQALRKRDHEERLQEQAQQAKERFAELIRELKDAGTLTEQEAQTISEIFDEFFGSGGVIEGSIENLAAEVKAMVDSIETDLGRAGVALESLERAKQARLDVTFIEPEGPQVPDELKTLEGFDFDDEQIKSQAKDVTKVIDGEFGEDGKIVGIFKNLVGKVREFFQVTIPDSLSDKEGLIGIAAAGVVETLNAFFGPKGEVDSVFEYLVGAIAGYVQAVITFIQRLRSVLAGLSNFNISTQSRTTSPSAIPMAEGGTLFADRPTTVTFGEAGPEVAKFVPLNRSNTNIGDVFGDAGDRTSKEDRLELLVRMQDGLVAEIIDSTLEQTANVIVNVERARL